MDKYEVISEYIIDRCELMLIKIDMGHDQSNIVIGKLFVSHSGWRLITEDGKSTDFKHLIKKVISVRKLDLGDFIYPKPEEEIDE